MPLFSEIGCYLISRYEREGVTFHALIGARKSGSKVLGRVVVETTRKK